MTTQTSVVEAEAKLQRGMADVVAGTTRLGMVDGARGKLWYCGYDVEDLARHSTYEETTYLLLYGELPTSRQLAALSQELAMQRRVNPALLQMLRTLPGAPGPMEALRTLVSAMSALDPSPLDKSRDANLRRAKRLIAQIPTLVAAHWRLRQGEDALQPSPELGYAANLYYMLHGAVPTAMEAHVLDIALILMAEHEFNASTFAVRVVASTLADLYAAFVAGLGALYGPLHGAANTEAMKMLLEVGSVDSVDSYVKGALAAKKKIMGFGHRVYKTWDPRAVILRDILTRMDGELPGHQWVELADKVQDTVFKHKALYPNVDFYAGPALYGLGFPMEMFTAVFACARSSGWAAHALEQYGDNRLIRPMGDYIGTTDRLYVPIDQR
jgi:citrate synthase